MLEARLRTIIRVLVPSVTCIGESEEEKRIVILLPAPQIFFRLRGGDGLRFGDPEISFSIFEIFVLALLALLFRKNVNARRD